MELIKESTARKRRSGDKKITKIMKNW
jgi:hypothetical protein